MVSYRSVPSLKASSLDTQYAFRGVTWSTPRIFWSTADIPPYDADAIEFTNTNEPYANIGQVTFIMTLKAGTDNESQHR